MGLGVLVSDICHVCHHTTHEYTELCVFSQIIKGVVNVRILIHAS